MAWIRLSDDYVDHQKFRHLSDGAFRLWHHLMAHCRKNQTDGLVPTQTLKQLWPYSPKRLKELLTPHMEGAHALLVAIPAFGFRVHDYLEWNLSKEAAEKERGASKQAMRDMRERRKNPRPDLAAVSPNSALTLSQKTRDVTGTGTDRDLDLEKKTENEWSGRGGPIIGRNTHLQHAACDPTLSRCVPSAVHLKLADTLAPKYDGDREAARHALLAWYPTIWATLARDFVMGEAFRFWQGRFDAAFASDPTPMSRRLTEDTATMAVAVLAMVKARDGS